MAEVSTLKLPIDSPARDAALDTTRSLIVQAPAGSGKTELLIRRMLRLLAQVSRPEEILAITFTRKAAAEMQARILAALHGAQSAPPAEPHRLENWHLARQALAQDQRHGWRLLENPNRLNICTIDSFNGRLVRRLPLAAGLAFNAHLADQSEPAYHDAARELLDSLNDAVPWADALEQLLLHLDNDFDRAERLFVELLKIRDQWLPHLYLEEGEQLRHHLERCLTELIDERLADAARTLRNLPDTLWPLVRFAVDQLHLAQIDSPILPLLSSPLPPPAEHSALPAWQALTQLLLTGEGEWRKRIDRNQGFPPASDARDPQQKSLLSERKAQMGQLLASLADDGASREALLEIRGLPRHGYSDQHWALLQALIALLKPLAALLKLVFQRRNEIDHNEVAAAALRALGGDEQPTDLALALDSQIRHLLVDEFQDTSSTQIALLSRLTHGWEAGDGRTLFLVGDPMQSIYRFREADVSHFLAAFHGNFNQLPLDAVRLTTNFRSTRQVVEWINDAIGNAFPSDESLAIGAVPYSRATAFDGSTATPDAITATLLSGPGARLLEAKALVTCLQQALQQPEHTIAVLVRARTHLQPLISELKSAGIAFSAVEVEPLERRIAIQDLRTLTAALLDPADRLAWFALLRSPLVGLTLADLTLIADQGQDPVIELLQQAKRCAQLSSDGAQRCQRLLTRITPSLQQVRRRPLRDWIEGCWLLLGGPATLRSAQAHDEAEAYFQLLERIETPGLPLDLDQLDAELSRLHAPSQGQTRVQLLTIHKAKGLEFDVVLLPGLEQSPPPAKEKLLNWHVNRGPHAPRLLMAPIAPGADRAQSNPINGYLKEIERKREAQEAIRLLYVAATRARARLHLFATVKRDPSGQPRAPDRRSFLAMLWPGILPEARWIEAVDEIDGEAKSAAQWHRLPADFAAPHLPDDGLLSRFRGHDFPYDPQRLRLKLQLDELDTQGARQFGELLHRAIETVAQEGIAQWDSQRLARSRDGWLARLRQLGYRGAAVPAVTRLQQIVQDCLQSPTFRWLLDPLHQQAENELAVSGWIDGELRHCVIDRTFVNHSGIRWIIDYKSSRPTADEALDAFLARETGQYRQQLLDYRTLMGHIDARPIRTALYFAQIDLLHEIGHEAR